MVEMQFILASNSPRRKELLGWTGISFRSHPADIDETPAEGEPPDRYVLRLAQTKAHAVARLYPGVGIIAADTTVADGTEIMGKPVDRVDARRMLQQLRGRIHFVHTAITLIAPDHQGEVVDLSSTPVKMREYSNTELEAYLDTGDPLDKAGAYAIQHTGFHPVENMEGCFACVVGLPLCHLVRALRRLNLGDFSEVPHICQQKFQYDCPVFQNILSA